MRLGLVLPCAVIAPFVVAASQPVRLQPSSPWVVDYGEQSCRLLRKFGAGDTETILVFESEAPEEMDMLLIGKPLRTGEEEVPARFLPVQEKPIKGRPVTSDEKGQPGILYGHIQLLPDEEAAKLEARMAGRRANQLVPPPKVDPGEELERRSARQAFAAKATALEIDGRRSKPVILETGSIGDAVKTFDKCVRDSLRDWGVDPDLEDKIARPVWLKNRDTLIRADDYPRAMLFAGQQSEVKVRVLVDASGRVTKCTSLSHFKLPEFTKLVCDKITRNGSFEPAELTDGTKVPSYYTVHINFRIAS
jgi:hypothetical protein